MLFKSKVSTEQKAESVAAYLPSFPIMDAGELAKRPVWPVAIVADGPPF